MCSLTGSCIFFRLAKCSKLINRRKPEKVSPKIATFEAETVENKKHIWVFASGSGTNAARLFRHFSDHVNLHISGLFTNRPTSGAADLAREADIPVFFLSDAEINEPGALLALLKKENVQGIILAGFLRKIPDDVVNAFPELIINIHPSLLPSFGGKGMYGMHVHRAVKQSGVTETGITVHLVNRVYDEGRILVQHKISLTPEDTPESIAARVQTLEHTHFAPVCDAYFSEIFGH